MADYHNPGHSGGCQLLDNQAHILVRLIGKQQNGDRH
jgi:hypothetical protein